MRYIIKLLFKNGLHIGADLHSENTESVSLMIHSDTIFSAIANQWVTLPPKIENKAIPQIKKIIEGLNSDSQPFLLSSAFPFVGEEYYLPTPVSSEPIFQKELKDIPYLELDDFTDIVQGRFKDREFKDPVENIVSYFTNPRVTIDRMTASSNIYFSGGTNYNRYGGLYFILDIRDEDIKTPLFASIRLLEDSGIGGDRSVGYGSFSMKKKGIDSDPRWEKLWEENGGDKNVYCSLSLCYPRDPEEAKNALSYQLVPRKGWIFSNSSLVQLKRRECRMFGEGSLFKGFINGKMADVTPREYKEIHNVYRYGLPMLVPYLSRG